MRKNCLSNFNNNNRHLNQINKVYQIDPII